jgi:ketosteroid isomerase-like protein
VKTILLCLLPVFSGFLSAADSPQEQLENLATAIQKGDTKGALELFDPATPSLAVLKRDIEGLAALPNTYCSITITKTEQAGDSITFRTDWSLQMYTVQNAPQLDRRDRGSVTMRRAGSEWKIVALSPVGVFTPPDDKIFKRIAQLAADLNDKDESGARGIFDSRMKQYGEIDNDIDALVTQNDLLCAIDIVSDRQTGDVHTLDVDWYLDLKSRADGGPSQQRRERVQVTMRQIDGKWKISNLDSLKILSPFTN